jgi:hypothetical protein
VRHEFLEEVLRRGKRGLRCGVLSLTASTWVFFAASAAPSCHATPQQARAAVPGAAPGCSACVWGGDRCESLKRAGGGWSPSRPCDTSASASSGARGGSGLLCLRLGWWRVAWTKHQGNSVAQQGKSLSSTKPLFTHQVHSLAGLLGLYMSPSMWWEQA